MTTAGEQIREFVVRVATPDEIDAVVALERATAFAPHWQREIYAEMARAGGPDDAPGKLQRCLIVARDGGRITGFAVGHFNIVLPDSAVLESVCVAPGLRRIGVGKALCNAVIQWCRGLGATEVALEVRASNAGAIALYKLLGFVEAGRRPRYYQDPQDDAVLMRLTLI
jgi:[ribosomal protein S18]-alanine N-acetyltransferase